MLDIGLMSPWVGALVSVLGAVTAIVIGISQRRKNLQDAELSESNAQESVSRAAALLIDPLQARIREQAAEMLRMQSDAATQRAQIIGLECQVDGMKKQYERELAELRAGIGILTQQVISLGAEPYYKPKGSS